MHRCAEQELADGHDEIFELRRPSTLMFGNVYDCGRCSQWHAGLASGFAVGPDILGRVFNGTGQVIDGGPAISATRSYRIDGLPINPAARTTLGRRQVAVSSST